ncbi:hypothetical protein ES703_00136 [subsurface metagenome]
MEKWQEQIEAILKEHYQDDEGMLKAANELISLIKEEEVPSGGAGQFVAQVLNLVASEDDLPPRVVALIGFRLGVAYARYKNINWSSGEK